jgi:positive regulator of sigma E activity
MEVEVADSVGHAVGDVVRLEVDGRIVLQAVGLLYGLPVLTLLSLLVFFVKVLRLPEIPAAVLGILALGPIAWGISRGIKRLLPERHVKPRIVPANIAPKLME